MYTLWDAGNMANKQPQEWGKFWLDLCLVKKLPDVAQTKRLFWHKAIKQKAWNSLWRLFGYVKSFTYVNIFTYVVCFTYVKSFMYVMDFHKKSRIFLFYAKNRSI